MISYLKKSKTIDFDSLNKVLEKKEKDFTKTHFFSLAKKIESLSRPKDISLDLSTKAVSIMTKDKSFDPAPSHHLLTELIPWKKGPFKLFDTYIDAEWDSSLKWERIKPHLGDQKEKVILDIGCNNGYFLFKLLELSPKLALGIDPIIPCFLQFQMINHFVESQKLKFELLGVEHLSYFKNTFDTILHMGILYHHRHPLEQLINIRESLKPGGMAIIETVGIPGENSTCLFPETTYANRPNVWFVPTLSCLINWCERTKFVDVEVISTEWQSSDEQRVTSWCKKDTSYEHALNSENPLLTKEGHPAPKRFCLKVKKKG